MTTSASVTSDCQIRRNSLRFRHNTNDEADWFDGSGSGSEDDDGSNGSGPMSMEVMDLRPSSHSAVHRMEVSSLVSLSSNMSIDSDLASGLFNVASGTTTRRARSNGGHYDPALGRSAAEVSDALRGDLPGHWERAGSGYTSHHSHGGSGASISGGASFGGQSLTSMSQAFENPLGESEQAYRALMSLMRSDHGNPDDTDSTINGTNNNNNGNADHRASFCSQETGRSGFWSALAPPPDAEDTSTNGSGRSEDGSSKVSESSPLTRARKAKRRVYLRKCARAMVTFLVLSALSFGTIFLLVEEDFDAVLSMMPGRGQRSGMVAGEEEEFAEGTTTVNMIDETRRLPAGLDSDNNMVPASHNMQGPRWGKYQYISPWRQGRQMKKKQAREGRKNARARRRASVEEEGEYRQQQGYHYFNDEPQEEENYLANEDYAAFEARRMMMDQDRRIEQGIERDQEVLFNQDYNHQYPDTEEGKRALLAQHRLQQQQQQYQDEGSRRDQQQDFLDPF